MRVNDITSNKEQGIRDYKNGTSTVGKPRKNSQLLTTLILDLHLSIVSHVLSEVKQCVIS